MGSPEQNLHTKVELVAACLATAHRHTQTPSSCQGQQQVPQMWGQDLPGLLHHREQGVLGEVATRGRRFYTDDSPGIKVGPVPVLVMSLLFISCVFMLHIWRKYN